MQTRLIVSCMSTTRCDAFHWLLFPLICIDFMLVLCALRPASFLYVLLRDWELTLLWSFAALCTGQHLLYCYCVVNELCAHLGIRAFVIVPRPAATTTTTSTASVSGQASAASAASGRASAARGTTSTAPNPVQSQVVGVQQADGGARQQDGGGRARSMGGQGSSKVSDSVSRVDGSPNGVGPESFTSSQEDATVTSRANKQRPRVD